MPETAGSGEKAKFVAASSYVRKETFCKNPASIGPDSVTTSSATSSPFVRSSGCIICRTCRRIAERTRTRKRGQERDRDRGREGVRTRKEGEIE